MERCFHPGSSVLVRHSPARRAPRVPPSEARNFLQQAGNRSQSSADGKQIKSGLRIRLRCSLVPQVLPHLTHRIRNSGLRHSVWMGHGSHGKSRFPFQPAGKGGKNSGRINEARPARTEGRTPSADGPGEDPSSEMPARDGRATAVQRCHPGTGCGIALIFLLSERGRCLSLVSAALRNGKVRGKFQKFGWEVRMTDGRFAFFHA